MNKKTQFYKNDLETLGKRVKRVIGISTIHGINQLTTTYHFKIIWYIGILVSIGICAYELITTLMIFLKFDVVSRIDRVNDLDSDFPSVSFCNLHRINYPKLSLDQNSDLRHAINRLIHPFNVEDNFTTAYDKVDSLIKKGFTFKQISQIIEQSIVTEINQNLTINLTYSIDEMLISCLYNNRLCDRSKFTEYLSLNHGSCFTFNSKRNETGHIISTKLIGRPGVRNGLRLEINIGQLESLPFWISTNGIVISIHHKDLKPLMSEEGIRIRPGAETNLIISKETFKRLNRPFNFCLEDAYSIDSYDSDEFRFVLRIYGRYRRNLCLSACSHIRSARNSKFENYSIFNISPVFVNEFYNSDNYKECLFKCPEECETIRYKSTVNMADYNNDNYTNLMFALRNESSMRKSSNKNMIMINIFLDNSVQVIISEVLTMSFSLLLSNIGGKLGLFLGISIISFLEGIEIMGLTFHHYYLKIREY